jgi:hypothetical protein
LIESTANQLLDSNYLMVRRTRYVQHQVSGSPSRRAAASRSEVRPSSCALTPPPRKPAASVIALCARATRLPDLLVPQCRRAPQRWMCVWVTPDCTKATFTTVIRLGEVPRLPAARDEEGATVRNLLARAVSETFKHPNRRSTSIDVRSAVAMATSLALLMSLRSRSGPGHRPLIAALAPPWPTGEISAVSSGSGRPSCTHHIRRWGH